jgi:hypothetical protein
MIKLSLMRTATGKADPELPQLQRIRSLELPTSDIAVWSAIKIASYVDLLGQYGNWSGSRVSGVMVLM